LRFEASPSKLFIRPYLQNNQSKMDWSRLKVECLLCKPKALSSNSSPTEKKEREGGRKE
jgi:hypothetical protein